MCLSNRKIRKYIGKNGKEDRKIGIIKPKKRKPLFELGAHSEPGALSL
jgi:hypothetical protein